MNNKKKIKLCIVIGAHWAHTFGGSQYQVKCLVDELIKTGDFDIYFLARGVNPSYQPTGYQVIKVGRESGLGKYGLFFDSLDLTRKLKKIEPDVIYQRVLSSYTGVVAHYARKSGCRFFWHVSSDMDVQASNIKLSRKIVPKYLNALASSYGRRHAQYVITQTEQQRDLLYRNYGRIATAVISNFHPYPREKFDKGPTLKIVWIGNFKPVKRPEIFVQLAQDLQDVEGIAFEMVGRAGNMREYAELHEKIAQLGNLTYHGEKIQDEVNQLLATSHIFVNTSREEGMPNTFIQAWMRNVAVLSLNVDVDGILKEGKAGYLAGSYNRLRKRITQLAENRENVISMAENGERLSLERFSITNAHKLIELIGKE